MDLTCQSYKALVVWLSGQYDKSDEDFKATHLEAALENMKLLKEYANVNEILYRLQRDKSAEPEKTQKTKNMVIKFRHDLLQFLRENE